MENSLEGCTSEVIFLCFPSVFEFSYVPLGSDTFNSDCNFRLSSFCTFVRPLAVFPLLVKSLGLKASF